MNIDRLPTSPYEKPALLAFFDEEKNKVQWAVEGDVFYDSPQFMDGSNWFQVWRDKNTIHCSTTQWYASGEAFSVAIPHMPPEKAVKIAATAANDACEYMDGDKS